MRELLNVLEKIKIEKKAPVTVSVVGGGGKTTLLYSLGELLCEGGNRVLLTTTTMLFYPEDYREERMEAVIIGRDVFLNEVLLKKKAETAEEVITEDVTSEDVTTEESKRRGVTVKRKPILLGDYITEGDEKKIKGFEKEGMEKLEKEGFFKDFDYILIEADGAKQCPIKAPGTHEPGIIHTTDFVIGIIGMDCLGRTLNNENVHRVAELSALLKKSPGAVLDEKDIETLVFSENGLFKDTPTSARKALILNKSEGVENIENAEKIIHEIRASEENKIKRIDYFMAASLEQEILYKYFPLKIAKVVFAAGNGKRMGAQKLLLDLNGTPILEQVLNTVENVDFSNNRVGVKGVLTETVLVYSDEKVKELGEKHKIDFMVKNPAPERGMSSSLKLAVSSIEKDVEAYLFFMGDQPFIRKETIEDIVKLWLKDTTRIVVPYFSGKRGNPVLFPSLLYDKLMKVEGDQGGRELIKSNLDKVVFMEVEDPKEGLDIDDPATYENLKGV